MKTPKDTPGKDANLAGVREVQNEKPCNMPDVETAWGSLAVIDRILTRFAEEVCGGRVSKGMEFRDLKQVFLPALCGPKPHDYVRWSYRLDVMNIYSDIFSDVELEYPGYIEMAVRRVDRMTRSILNIGCDGATEEEKAKIADALSCAVKNMWGHPVMHETPDMKSTQPVETSVEASGIFPKTPYKYADSVVSRFGLKPYPDCIPIEVGFAYRGGPYGSSVDMGMLGMATPLELSTEKIASVLSEIGFYPEFVDAFEKAHRIAKARLEAERNKSKASIKDTFPGLWEEIVSFDFRQATNRDFILSTNAAAEIAKILLDRFGSPIPLKKNPDELVSMTKDALRVRFARIAEVYADDAQELFRIIEDEKGRAAPTQ